MSIRITALYIVVIALACYAWKDWFKSLCGLILMMAIFEHEDMPRTMFGIPGLNMWNVLFFVWMDSTLTFLNCQYIVLKNIINTK